MEKEDDKNGGNDYKAAAAAAAAAAPEPDFLLQWGNRKRLRCVRAKDSATSRKFGGVRRKVASRIDRCFAAAASSKQNSHLQPHRFTRNSEGATLLSSLNETRKLSSPEKEDRYYATRGSVGVDENGKVSVDVNASSEDRGAFVWPKLYIALSSKEKEEDFLAMKGCKPPQRPKKRAKIIQRTLLLVSPGAWLTDMSQERYEVREKKNSKKRPRGLKAMGNVESESE